MMLVSVYWCEIQIGSACDPVTGSVCCATCICRVSIWCFFCDIFVIFKWLNLNYAENWIYAFPGPETGLPLSKPDDGDELTAKTTATCAVVFPVLLDVESGLFSDQMILRFSWLNTCWYPRTNLLQTYIFHCCSIYIHSSTLCFGNLELAPIFQPRFHPGLIVGCQRVNEPVSHLFFINQLSQMSWSFDGAKVNRFSFNFQIFFYLFGELIRNK